MTTKRKQFLIFICLGFLLSSCQPKTPATGNPEISLPPQTPSPITVETPEPAPTSLPAEAQNPLSLGPWEVVFFSEDGAELQGLFYPSAFQDRPVVILMHWYQGDQQDWTEIAFWLQNRGGSGEQRGTPWLDPSWFPALTPGTSYNVLTFNFRDCAGGCRQAAPEHWLKDARASLAAARSLEGVNPDQIVVIGASIGADAAIASCGAAFQEDPTVCLGALSLSPGSYLGESYPEQVDLLENANPPRPAWCLFGDSDPDATVCLQASGLHYYQEGWSGGNLHGMHLLTSMLEPLPLLRVVEFLEWVCND